MGTNLERAQASRARLAAPRTTAPVVYAGSNVKDALRAIGLLNLMVGVAGGVYLMAQDSIYIGCALLLEGVLAWALLFGLAAIIENLIAIRQNTES